jgi:hypothetical protein
LQVEAGLTSYVAYEGDGRTPKRRPATQVPWLARLPSRKSTPREAHQGAGGEADSAGWVPGLVQITALRATAVG